MINRKEGSHEFSGSSLNSIGSRRLSDEYKTVEMAWKYIVDIIELTHINFLASKLHISVGPF